MQNLIVLSRGDKVIFLDDVEFPREDNEDILPAGKIVLPTVDITTDIRGVPSPR